jgi:hypothetical protein
MKSSQTIAIWLLECLDLDVALAGDLLEECARGRSAIWYWRQVLIAVWGGLWGAIRDHKLLTLRAIATGFATEYLFIFLWFRYVPDLRPFSPEQWLAQVSGVLFSQAATGWVVSRTHRAHQVPTALAFLTCFLGWYVYGNFFWAQRVLMGSIDTPNLRPYAAMFLLTFFMTIAGVLLGTTLARHRRTS